MKQVWLAEDGMIFNEQYECQQHEVVTDCRAQLQAFFDKHISYNTDAGSHVADSVDIVDIITVNFDELMGIVAGGLCINHYEDM